MKITGNEPELKSIGKRLASMEVKMAEMVEQELNEMCLLRKYKNLSRADINSQAMIVQRTIMNARKDHMRSVKIMHEVVKGMTE